MPSMVPKSSFHCKGDLITGGLQSAERQHFYCPQCLNFVYSQIGNTADTRINLRSSILDRAAEFRPYVSLICDHRHQWIDLNTPHNFQHYPSSQTELDELFQGYQAF